jgi:tetratricopeptide (TPR) repeat protein
MSQRRRIAWIIVALVVLGGVGVGVWWHVRASTGWRLLAKGQLALNANNLDKAGQIAATYIEKNPADWRGYSLKADALVRQGKYPEAKAVLLEAAKRAPDAVEIRLAQAATCYLPASQTLELPATRDNVQAIQRAIEGLGDADRALSGFQAKNEADSLLVGQEIGRNLGRLAHAQRLLADRFDREARVADASRQPDVASTKRQRSQHALAASRVSQAKAIALLLNVVLKQPSREVASETLVRMCIEVNDGNSLAAARKAIFALNDPPPMATVLLAQEDVKRRPGEDPAKRRQRTDEATKRLDNLIAMHPDNTSVKLGRAQVAAEAGDLAMAERLSAEVVKTDKRASGARLLHARILLLKGDTVNAERELFSLKADFPTWYQVQYWYAKAAQAAGKVELAREAMRTVTHLVPDHPDARKLFAELLLQGGFYEQAYADADAFYKGHPDDPESLRLYIEAARETDRPDLAREAMLKAWKQEGWDGYARNPVMRMIISDGYAAIGDREQAEQILDDVLAMAAKEKPVATEDVLAVAQALNRKGRSPEAEKLVADKLASDPNEPRLCFALASVLNDTGRGLQAEDYYRKAVRASPHKPQYRLALARALLNVGALNEAEEVLSPVAPISISAELVTLQIKALRGEPIDAAAQAVLQRPDAGKRFGVPLAMIYLANGQPDQCKNLCLQALRDNPNKLDFREPLARAYEAMGQRDLCMEEWKRVVTGRPESLPPYQRLASLLLAQTVGEDVAAGGEGGAKSKDEPQKLLRLPLDKVSDAMRKVYEKLQAVPLARKDNIDFAMGQLHADLGQPVEAADYYARTIASPGANDFLRYRAELLRAAALAQSGRLDEGLRHLDQVISRTKGIARTRALYGKADLLARARRMAEAEAVLVQLCAEAEKDKDAESLRQAANLRAQLGNYDVALATCDVVERMVPGDPRSYLLRADVLSLARRKIEDVPNLYKRAIELQPGDYGLYVRLADIRDAQDKPLEALDTLKKLAAVGEGCRPIALYEEGLFFIRRGLNAQAIERFEAIGKLAHGPSPQLDLALGRALTALGRKDAARDAIGRISEYTQEYIPAQILLAEAAEPLEAKLSILGALGRKRPRDEQGLARRMSLLIENNRPAEAMKAFRNFRATPGGALPVGVGGLAIQAAVQDGNMAEARETAKTLAQASPLPQWRTTAAVLTMDNDPAGAAKYVAEPEKAGVFPAELGLCLAKRAGDIKALRAWHARLDKLDADLKGLGRRIPPVHRFLCGLLAGDEALVKDQLKGFGTGSDLQAGEELVAHAAASKAAPEETIRLIQSLVALDLGQTHLALRWAMEALRARPNCQWAASQIAMIAVKAEDLQAASDLLQPKDCELAKALQAALLLSKKQYKEAAEVYAALARKGDKPDPTYLLRQATALEQAEEMPKALDIYRQVWRLRKDPVAANNAAALTVQLHPDDKDKLAEAQEWADAALKEVPLPQVQDTAGWLAHLRGRSAEALTPLRKAIKGLPGSPDVHYHLGQVEATAGDAELAKWHLAAAVQLGANLKAKGEPMSKATEECVRLAQAALNKLDAQK